MWDVGPKADHFKIGFAPPPLSYIATSATAAAATATTAATAAAATVTTTITTHFQPYPPGNMVHYSPYDHNGGVHPGPLVTDNGFWDTFRTCYPLYSLLFPEISGFIIAGWLNAYKEGGWLPKWASPGYRTSMVGTFADVSVADAIVKRVPGFDTGLAWEAIKKDSFTPEPRGMQGAVAKVGLEVYNSHQYIPYDSGVSEFVSRSLDFAFADSATSRAAKVLGSSESISQHDRSQILNDGERLWSRAIAVLHNLYDQQTGLMRPKNSRGEFDRNFNPVSWGGGYTEGSAWHHSFPPFAIDVLAGLHGGAPALAAKLHELVDTPGTFHPGGYGQTIHEMEEMRAFAMGQ